MVERTFAMIKPDGVQGHHIGAIIDIIEKAGFKILALRMEHLSTAKAEKFYAVHKERPFFGSLISSITSGPVVAMALEKENAIKAWRDLMGATDPQKAEAGTIRKQFGISLDKGNATHGSDASETAKEELALLFPELK
ncbi:MAG TPA: nucleoside-diphosphate kinase [Rhabdochlamydiaceae bacterium]